MKNRNLLIFVVASMVLLVGHAWLTSRFYPAPPEAPKQAQAQPAQQAQAQPQAAPAATPAPAAAPAAPVAHPGATRTVSLAELRLTFRLHDGAIQQVEWLKDGTRFFPEKDEKKKRETFPGIGGVQGATFDALREEKESRGGGEVAVLHFENGAGERLTYRIPDRGHIVEVLWSTPRPAALALIRKPSDDRAVASLGRVFTLGDKGIDAVTWPDVLQDPMLSFLGRKRKELPPATARLGLDAGLNKGSDSQSTHYFTALWDLERPAVLDASGYTALPLQGQAKARLYLGPKEGESLKAFGPAFTQVVDFGFFGLVAQGMFWILTAIHKVFPNWGWAIILFTVIIRGALWPLNTKTTIQMLRSKDLEPHQKEIQAKYEKFGNDMAKKAEMQKELMAFYKKNGHNPLGGCLPMVLQMPVFFALWSMLNAVFELRNAPWIFWIKDLSTADPFYVLPILLGVSMLAQQVATPAMGDPTQRKMMTWLMPGMMTFMFLNFAAGLNLYYLVFNLIGLVQTYWIKRSYVPEPVTT